MNKIKGFLVEHKETIKNVIIIVVVPIPVAIAVIAFKRYKCSRMI